MKTKIKDLLQAALAELEQEDKPAWTLTRHLPGFRPLRDGEEWHRQDWTEDMLAGGWRPVLAREQQEGGDEFIGQSAYKEGSAWRTVIGNLCSPAEIFPALFQRTRRPLPEPAKVVPWDFETAPLNFIARRKNGDLVRVATYPNYVVCLFGDYPKSVCDFLILTYTQLFEDYLQLDGKPCGKEVAP